MGCAPMPQSASDRPDGGPSAAGHSVFVSAQDGLRLHVRAYGARTNRALPVVCLPGLARTTADFDTLAAALSSDRERQRAQTVRKHVGPFGAEETGIAACCARAASGHAAAAPPRSEMNSRRFTRSPRRRVR